MKSILRGYIKIRVPGDLYIDVSHGLIVMQLDTYEEGVIVHDAHHGGSLQCGRVIDMSDLSFNFELLRGEVVLRNS